MMGFFSFLRRHGPEMEIPVPPPKPRETSLADLAAAVAELAGQARRKNEEVYPFRPAFHPPQAMPPKGLRMAMDASLNWAEEAAAGNALNSIASEGVTFLGYPYLSLLAQRPEYRVISETIATEATRKWIEFKARGDGDKSERIQEIVKEFERLQVRDRFCEIATQDGFFGRSHLYIDLGVDIASRAPELKTAIGDGRNALSRAKVKKGSLKALRCIEAVWTYPTTYNATNPLAENWYNPQVWYTMGTEVHGTRLLTFVGHPVPDLLKPAYSFGGLSLSQMVMPYVDIWLETRESIGKVIHSFSVMVLKTKLGTLMQPGVGDALLARVAGFNVLRDNQGTFVVDKDTEDFANVSASLAGLHELQAQAQEHMMSVARIPAVKFTGIQPTGLNASSEGEIRVFYDTIGAYQNSFFRPNLQKVIDFTMLSLWGEIDKDITWDFVPLWSLNEKEQAELRKTEAETGQILVDTGVVAPEEERRRVANDPDSPYEGLDPDDMPDLLEEEEGGLEPEGGRPQVVAQEVEEGDNDADPTSESKAA